MISTERLILRNWHDSDRLPFNAMGRDPAIMEFLGPLQTQAETDAAIARLQGFAAAYGQTFWAVERRADAQFLGFCGLKIAPENIPGIKGAIEIGWRLRPDAWGAAPISISTIQRWH